MIHLATARVTAVGSSGGAVGLATVAVGLAAMTILPRLVGYGPDDGERWVRMVAWGLPAGAVIGGAVIAERGGWAVRSRTVLLLGAASYAVYLLHPIAIGALIQLPPVSPLVGWVACLAATVAIVALATGFHLLVEAPLLRRMRRWVGQRPGPLSTPGPRHGIAAALAVLLGACERSYPPPPPATSFAGLPVSGSLADAQRAGFARCWSDSSSLRCRGTARQLHGQGPFEAAVDLLGSDGRGGYDHITLWHDSDQYAVQAVGAALKEDGWTVCFTGQGIKGDQAIYTRPGSPVRVAIDLSYYIKRRLRVFPESGAAKPGC